MQFNPDQSNLTDNEVIKSVIDGKKQDFEILSNRYYKRILAYLCRLLNFNQGDAEDVLQDTFLNAYVNLVTYNPNLSFSSWLYRIAHNLAVDLIRKNAKYYTLDTNDIANQNHIHDNQAVIVQTESELEKPINKNRLSSILKKLDLETRNILTLFYLQGLSLEEISDISKTTTNAVASRLKRARDKARKIISQFNL